VSHVHKNAHGFGREYSDKCDNCYKVYEEKGIGGCVHHSVPMYTRRGDVTTTAYYVNRNVTCVN
jgi:hypothetical protein